MFVAADGLFPGRPGSRDHTAFRAAEGDAFHEAEAPGINQPEVASEQRDGRVVEHAHTQLSFQHAVEHGPDGHLTPADQVVDEPIAVDAECTQVGDPVRDGVLEVSRYQLTKHLVVAETVDGVVHCGLVKGEAAAHHGVSRLHRLDEWPKEHVLHAVDPEGAVVELAHFLGLPTANGGDVVGRGFIPVPVKVQCLDHKEASCLLVNLHPRWLGIRARISSEYSIISYFSNFVNYNIY